MTQKISNLIDDKGMKTISDLSLYTFFYYKEILYVKLAHGTPLAIPCIDITNGILHQLSPALYIAVPSEVEIRTKE